MDKQHLFHSLPCIFFIMVKGTGSSSRFNRMSTIRCCFTHYIIAFILMQFLVTGGRTNGVFLPFGFLLPVMQNQEMSFCKNNYLRIFNLTGLS